MIRCDEAMRRSKERCYTPEHTRWRCTKDCKNCICCLEKEGNGQERHFKPASKGERYEFKEEGE